MNKFRFTACLVLITIIASCVPVFAGITPVQNSVLGRELGILPFESYDSETVYVTRGEFAYIASKLAGAEASNYTQKGEVFYKDVPAGHEWADYINALTRLGYVSGYSDGYYEPDYNVTYQEAACVFARILGFELEAEQKGGYPTGYTSIAARLGLFGSMRGDKYITQRAMCEAVGNVLESERCIVDTMSGNTINYRIDKENTILKTVFGVEIVKGIVDANEFTSILSGAGKADKGKIIIGQKSYKCGTTDATNMLGKQVAAYVEKESETIVAIFEQHTNTVTIYDEDIDPRSDRTAIYAYDNNDNLVSYKTDATGVRYIYNGKRETGLTASDIFIKNGYLTLTDNNNDNVYDIVSVTKYDTCFVDSVSEANEKISNKLGKTLELRNKEYKIYKNNAEIALSEIKTNDIINYTVTKDGETFALYVISGEYVTGTVDGTADDEYIIGGSGYKLSADYDEAVTNGKMIKPYIGFASNFYLDIRGRIAGYMRSADAEGSKQYGYLLTMGGDYELGGDGVRAKIFTQDGEMKIFNLSKKVKVDGKSYSSDPSFLNDVKTRNSGDYYLLITFKQNADEEINFIDTQYVVTANGETKENSLTMGDMSTWSSLTWFNRGAGNASGRFLVDGNTIMFDVPDPTSSLKDDESLYKVGKNVIANGSESTMAGYDLQNYVASVVVRRLSGGGSAGYTDPVAMVKEITEVYDTETEEVSKAILFMNGKEYKLSKSDLVTNIAEGDTIRYALDAKQQIGAIGLLYDASAGVANTKRERLYIDNYSYSIQVIEERKGTRFIAARLTGDTGPGIDTASRLIYPMNSGAQVYVHDSVEDEIYVGDVTELDDVLYSKNSNVRVLITQVYGGVTGLYIYK